MATFFPNVSEAFKAGLVTPEMIDEWLVECYGSDTEAAATKRAATIKEDGSMVLFQIVSLHRLAQDNVRERDAVAAEAALAEVAPRTDIPDEFKADIPDLGDEQPLPDIAAEIKKRVGIISGVRKWGKHQDRINDVRVEGVKVRCPFDDHTDYRPSAWVNTDKNTWYCGKCSVGGDVIDFFAARRYGLRPEAFHRSTDFHTIVREMGDELGFTVYKTSTGWEMVEDGVDIPSPLPDRPEEETHLRDEVDGVTALDERTFYAEAEALPEPDLTDADFEEMMGIPKSLDYEGPDIFIDWQDYAINPGSFLGEWMQFAERYYAWCPQEYFFWLGLQAIGIACGHSTQGETDQPLNGNLMLTLVGPSGGGKSTAVGELKRMFGRLSLTKFDPETGNGVKTVSNPASAEALVKSIFTEVSDPTDVTKKIEVPTTAWLYVDELADIVAKADRRGGGNMKTVFISLYDFVKRGLDPELSIDEYAITSGARRLHDSHFSATFTTQPAAMSLLMGKVDLVSGFLGRIIPVYGKGRKKRTYVGGEIPTDYPFDVPYEVLWRKCRDTSRRVMTFTPEAQDLINSSEVFESMAPNHVPHLLARCHLFVFKISMLLAVNNGEREIGREYVESAIKIVSNYVTAAFGGLDEAVSRTESIDLETKIVDFIRNWYAKRGVWPTNRDLTNYSNFKKKVASGEFNKIRNGLITSDLIALVSIRTSGAPKKLLVVPEGKFAKYAGWDSKVPLDESAFYA